MLREAGLLGARAIFRLEQGEEKIVTDRPASSERARSSGWLYPVTAISTVVAQLGIACMRRATS